MNRTRIDIEKNSRSKGLRRMWEEVTPPSKKCRNARPPILGRAHAPISLMEVEPSHRSPHFADLPTES